MTTINISTVESFEISDDRLAQIKKELEAGKIVVVVSICDNTQVDENNIMTWDIVDWELEKSFDTIDEVHAYVHDIYLNDWDLFQLHHSIITNSLVLI